MLGLYKGMVDIMKVDMVMLHKAMLANNLEDFIKQCFESYPSQNRVCFIYIVISVVLDFANINRNHIHDRASIIKYS